MIFQTIHSLIIQLLLNLSLKYHPLVKIKPLEMITLEIITLKMTIIKRTATKMITLKKIVIKMITIEKKVHPQ